MVVLGLILILLGVLVGGYTVMGGLPGEAGTDVSLSFLGLNVQTSAVVVFALGALTLLLVELGVLAMRSGARKSSKRRAELQRLRRVEAEVRTRESAESQRNATATPAAAAAPAPFARRESTGDTGSHEPVRSDRPDTYRPETHRSDAHRADGEQHESSRTAAAGTTGAGGPGTTAGTETRRDLSDVRPPETGSQPTGTGSTADGVTDTRTDRS